MQKPPSEIAPIVAYLEQGGLTEMSGMIAHIAAENTHVAIDAPMLAALVWLASEAAAERQNPVRIRFGT
jgi:hypothetical protein